MYFEVHKFVLGFVYVWRVSVAYLCIFFAFALVFFFLVPCTACCGKDLLKEYTAWVKRDQLSEVIRIWPPLPEDVNGR